MVISTNYWLHLSTGPQTTRGCFMAHWWSAVHRLRNPAICHTIISVWDRSNTFDIVFVYVAVCSTETGQLWAGG